MADKSLERLRAAQAQAGGYLGETFDTPGGAIPRYKKVTIGAGGGGAGGAGQPQAPVNALAGATMVDYNAYAPVNELVDNSWGGMDYMRGLGAGAGQAVGALGTAADVVGTSMTRAGQNAAQWAHPELQDIRNTPEGLAQVENNWLSTAGRPVAQAGQVASDYYTQNMSPEAQAALQGGFFENPSWLGAGLRLTQSIPGMVMAGGPAMAAGSRAAAGALAGGATRAAALKAGGRAAIAPMAAAGGAIQAGSVADQTYSQVMAVPADQIAATNPEGWQNALRQANGNKEVAKHIIAVQARDAAFYPAFAISAASNALMGAGAPSLFAQRGAAAAGRFGTAGKVAGFVAGKEGAQEFVEEGGGALAGNLATQQYADRDHNVAGNTLAQGAEGWLFGRAFDVPGNMLAGRDFVTGMRAQTPPPGGSAPHTENPAGDLLNGAAPAAPNSGLPQAAPSPVRPGSALDHALRAEEVRARTPAGQRPNYPAAGVDLTLAASGFADPRFPALAQRIRDAGGVAQMNAQAPAGSQHEMFPGAGLQIPVQGADMQAPEAPHPGQGDWLAQMEAEDAAPPMGIPMPGMVDQARYGQPPERIGRHEVTGVPMQVQPPQGAVTDMFSGQPRMPPAPTAEEAAAVESNTQHADMIRQQAIRMRKQAKVATGPAREALLASAKALDTQADTLGRSAAPAGGFAPLELPVSEAAPAAPAAPAGPVTLADTYPGKKLKNWVGKTSKELREVATAAGLMSRNTLYPTAKRQEAKMREAQATDAADFLDQQAGVEAPAAPASVAAAPKPAGVEHSLYDPMLNAPASAAHRGESGWLYRVASEEEVQDIRDSGVVRSRQDVDNGKGNRKYWTRGVGTNGKTLALNPSGGKVWIRIREDAVAPAVGADSVQVMEDGAFRSITAPKPAAPKTLTLKPAAKPAPAAAKPAAKVEPKPAPVAAPKAEPAKSLRKPKAAAKPAVESPKETAPATRPALRANEDTDAPPSEITVDNVDDVVHTIKSVRNPITIRPLAEKLRKSGVLTKEQIDAMRGLPREQIEKGIEAAVAAWKKSKGASPPPKAQPGAAPAVNPAAKSSTSTPKGDTQYSKKGETAEAGTGVAVADAKAMVAKIDKKLGITADKQAKVTVVATPEEAGLEGVEPDAKGAYQNGKVYIFADRNATLDDIAFTYQHELVGHLGLRETYGVRLVAELSRLMENAAFAALMKRTRIEDNRTGLSDYELAEEVVSDIAGFDIAGNATTLDRLINGVMDIVGDSLRAVGVQVDNSDAAMQRRIRVLVANSKKSLRGTPSAGPLAISWKAVTDGFAGMADTAKNFKYQFSDSKDFRDHLKTVLEHEPGTDPANWKIRTGGIYGPHSVVVEYHPPGAHKSEVWTAKMEQVDEEYSPGDYAITINSAGLRNHVKNGAGIYQALMHYAQVRGARVLGDDVTLYAGNELRRTDAMLSAILRAGGDTRGHVPSAWQFTGLISPELRAELRAAREKFPNASAYPGGLGALRLSDLRFVARKPTFTAGQQAQLDLLNRVERESEAARTRLWQRPEHGVDYTTEEGQQDLAAMNAHNFSVLAAAFRNRVAMEAPDLTRVYIRPSGDIYLLAEPLSEFSTLDGAEHLGQIEQGTGTMAQLLETLGYNPAETGVGVGTAMRMALINSMQRSSLAANTRGLRSQLQADGAGWAQPDALSKLAARYNGPLLYSKANASSEYRELLSRAVREPAAAAKEIGAGATGIWKFLANPKITRSEGMGLGEWLLSTAQMHNPNLLARSNIARWVKDKALFLDGSFVALDKHIRRKVAIAEMWQNRTHEVITQYERLDRAAHKELGSLMVDATLDKIDPSIGWNEQKHLHTLVNGREKYDALVARYNSLGETARGIYLSARKLFDDQRKAQLAAVKALGTDSDPAVARLISLMENDSHGPYFPLRRFGRYVVVAKQTAVSGEELGRVVEAYETEREAEERIVEMQNSDVFKGWDVYAPASSQSPDADVLPAAIREQLKKAIELRVDQGKMTKAAGSAMTMAIEDVYIANLPGMPAAKAWMRRKNRKGANTDMQRAIAQSGHANASRIADLETSRDVADAQVKMKESAAKMMREAKTPEERSAARDAQTIYEHIRKVDDAEAKTLHPIARVISQIGPLWYLVTPRFWAMQPMQLVNLTLPKLASKVAADGSDSMIARYTAAGTHIVKAFNEVSPVVWDQFKEPLRSMMETKDKSQSRFSLAEKPFQQMIDEIKVPTGKGDATRSLSAGEKKMLVEMNQRNLISVTMAYEVMNVAQQGNPTWQKFVKGAMWPAQNLELINRMATGLASYRMATERDGLSHDEATDYAAEVITETQVDYSEANRPWLLHSKLLGNAAPLAMFQMYRQNMLWNLTYYGRKALAGDKEAQRFFVGMMVTHAFWAGAAGLPLIGGVAAIVGALVDAGDDEDDPEYDPWEELRAGVSEFVGPQIAEMLLYGVPRGAGADLHGAMGINSLYVSEYANIGVGGDAVKSMLVSALGVPATFAVNLGTAAEQVSSGDYSRAFKTVAPKIVKDTMGAAQGGGLETAGGQQAVEGSVLNTALKLLGVTPAEHARYYEGRAVEKDVTDFRNSHKAKIFKAAAEAKSIKERAALQRMVEEYNAGNPEAPISSRMIKAAVKARTKEAGQYGKSTLGLTARERKELGQYLAPYEIDKSEEP